MYEGSHRPQEGCWDGASTHSLPVTALQELALSGMVLPCNTQAPCRATGESRCSAAHAATSGNVAAGCDATSGTGRATWRRVGSCNPGGARVRPFSPALGSSASCRSRRRRSTARPSSARSLRPFSGRTCSTSGPAEPASSGLRALGQPADRPLLAPPVVAGYTVASRRRWHRDDEGPEVGQQPRSAHS